MVGLANLQWKDSSRNGVLVFEHRLCVGAKGRRPKARRVEQLFNPKSHRVCLLFLEGALGLGLVQREIRGKLHVVKVPHHC